MVISMHFAEPCPYPDHPPPQVQQQIEIEANVHAATAEFLRKMATRLQVGAAGAIALCIVLQRIVLQPHHAVPYHAAQGCLECTML